MYEIGYSPANLKDAENAVYYYMLLIQSLEAKITRVDPFSEEFNKTMSRLFDARKESERLGHIRLAMNYQEAMKDYAPTTAK